ncbi:hypothetical protein Tco_1403375 [Tanacetum coccineum]
MKQVHAIIDGKAVVISESSMRSDLLFNYEDGITCLTNDEIFENLALMGYEQLSTKLTFQKGKVTPLFDSMLVQNQAPKGEGSATPPEPQPTPSTSQANVYEPLTEPIQTETLPPVKENTYEEINELYERQQKRNQDFIPMDSEKEAQKSEEEAAEYEKEKEELRKNCWFSLRLFLVMTDDCEL